MELDHCGDCAYHLKVVVGLDFLSVLNLNMVFDFGDDLYTSNYSKPETAIFKKCSVLPEPYTKITLSRADFIALLLQMIDWNVAAGSYRVRVFRKPEQYLPQAYVLLSVLHL